jgi:hypothetical protein
LLTFFTTLFCVQVNASALSAPLSTDVTLVSHKVEFSEDSSFSSISKIGALEGCFDESFSQPATECSIEGFTPIAGQMPFTALNRKLFDAQHVFRKHYKCQS